MCDHNYNHEERVFKYWEEYKRDVPEHSLEKMMIYFNLSESEATEILNHHPELQ